MNSDIVLAIISVIVGIIWGIISYKAIMHRDVFCVIALCIIISFRQAEITIKSEVFRAFAEGLVGKTDASKE